MMRLFLSQLLLLLVPTLTRAVYRLRFLGDYQSGAWDTDAAENVAFDPRTQRAFVASAESKNLQVVSLVDPTAPANVGTIAVAAVMEEQCMEVDCQYESMDFGGAGATCGFAETVRIVHDRPDFDCCSWFRGEFELDPEMTSADACQRKCADEPLCSYWSFENECERHAANDTCTPTRHNECYLKARYSEADGGDDCVDYVVWEEGPRWDTHDYDSSWTAAAGPAACGHVVAESVQAVALVRVAGYDAAVVVAATPHAFPWASGYLAFFDASTQVYLGCAEAGNKPEGIVADKHRVAVVNEGSARADGKMDHPGSATSCDLVTTFNPTIVNFHCATYTFVESNFVEGAFVSPVIYRSRGLRLYGPDGDDISLDLEPEHAAFLLGGTVLFVSFQDNNGYAYLDLTLEPPKYTYLHGYEALPATLDASDDDGYINIKSRFGDDGTRVSGLAMPDVVTAIEVDGVQYVLTANEGDTRDGEADVIGVGEARDVVIRGEEVRYGFGSPPVATCDGCATTRELGRLLTTTFGPSDFATNACGGNACDAQALAEALNSEEDFACQYEFYDYGRGGGDHPCGAADATLYLVSSADWVPPSWYASGAVLVDETMLTPGACQAACAASVMMCDYWSFEVERNVGECLFKLPLTDCPYEAYSRWQQKWDDFTWRGWSGPAVCEWPRPPYTSSEAASASTSETGSEGGSFAIGGRSFSVWKFKDVASPLELVFDSGSDMEVATSRVAHGLCDDCFQPPGGGSSDCARRCPFNSDEAPPVLDDRSDAKGPEPECLATGTTADGAILAFVGLERTGGIVTYDVSDPKKPEFQDFLNVRNWLVSDVLPSLEDDVGPFMLKYGLNDGPESLLFVPAKESAVGRDLVVAAAPLAGRLTAYLVEGGQPPRLDDGSCEKIATCEYVPASDGGDGSARTVTMADICDPAAPCALLDEVVVTQTSKKSSSAIPAFLLAVLAALSCLVVLALAAAATMTLRAKAIQTKYDALTEKNAIHEQELAVLPR